MLGKAGYSLFLISPSSRRHQLQHLPNTPPAPKTLLIFLPLARSDFTLPPAPFAAREAGQGAARQGGEWVRAAGVVGGSPTAEHRRRERDSTLSRVRNPPWASSSDCLAFTGRVSSPYPPTQKGLHRGKGEIILIPKDVVQISPLLVKRKAVFCSVAFSSMSFVSSMWDYMRSLPCFTDLFLPL